MGWFFVIMPIDVRLYTVNKSKEISNGFCLYLSPMPHRGQGVVRMAVARCGKEFPREHPLGTALQKGSVDVAGDSYRTVAAPAEAACRERSSKFLSWIYPVRTEEEIRERLDALRKRYYLSLIHI